MTSSQNFATRRSVLCSICARHVELESSKTDERGKAVHENCYVRRTIGAFRMAKEEAAEPIRQLVLDGSRINARNSSVLQFNALPLVI
jgi:hypothetical protein